MIIQLVSLQTEVIARLYSVYIVIRLYSERCLYIMIHILFFLAIHSSSGFSNCLSALKTWEVTDIFIFFTVCWYCQCSMSMRYTVKTITAHRLTSIYTDHALNSC